MANEKTEGLIYRGRPLRRIDNLIYYGTMADKYIVMMQIQDTKKVQDLRIVAMERTMMQRNGIHYGDTILVKGTGVYDGEWVVEDTMHPRNAGQDRIDFLVPEEIKLGRWDNVEVYKKSVSRKIN